MTAVVVRGDAARLPLPDACVDLVVTSPPYFGLRSYADGGEHYDGQIGSEATPAEYLEALWACTAEWVRVLKPGGSVFVNLGDKYSTGNSGQSGLAELGKRWAGGGHSDGKAKQRSRPVPGMPPKSLLGLPWRYAIGCTDRLGLILRAEIVWAKPNGLPESVTDRVRRSHEQVFHFTRLPRYYSAVGEIREPHTGNTHGRRADGQMSPKERATVEAGHRRGFFPENRENPLGKLPGSVWSIPSAPLVVPESLGVDHFAAYPPELVRRIVLGWSPPGVCTACGEGRRPVSTGTKVPHYAGGSKGARNGMRRVGTPNDDDALPRTNTLVTITGYACGCPVPDAPARPALVVDPFGGTGTTALVASAYGRTGVTVDRSGDYCRLAAWRTRDPGERARALNVPKPPPVPEGQASLFDEAAS